MYLTSGMIAMDKIMEKGIYTTDQDYNAVILI